MKKFKVVTLGCRTNQYESQAYRDQLLEMGYTEANEDEQADLCLVNTCTVTQSADQTSRHQIRKLIRQNPGSKVVVTGCLAERKPELIRGIGGVTQVVSNRDKETLLNQVFPDETIPEFSIKQFEAHTRAFVKVQDGCNSFCTYCIIPYVRGRSRSRPLEEIKREVEQLVANDYKEVVITGINVGDYEDGENKLAHLVRAIDEISGLKRLRLSSIDPDEVNTDLLEAIVRGKNTCQSMHIVLQSGSNVTLKRMNRKYSRQIFLETVEKLKKASPYFTFTTDVIVGFPGETEVDFQETLEVMKEVQFAKVHMFPYSRREKTRAALYPNQVSEEVINHRKQLTLRAAEQGAYALREQFVGKEMEVLTEKGEGEFMRGHTDNFLEVFFPKGNYTPNQFVQVELLKNTPEGFLGRVK